jgi:hypothetical protein
MCTGLDCTLSPAATAGLPNGTYRWKLLDYGASYGYGTWTDWLYFTIAVPQSLTQISPRDTLDSWNNTFHFTGITGATKYRLYVMKGDGSLTYTNTFYNVGVDVMCIGLDCTLSPAATAGLTNGAYRWKLLDYSASYGYGTWTDWLYFTLNY